MATSLLPSRLINALTSHRRWLLLALLGLLHLVLLQGPEDGFARMLFLGHLGLVLLWQPVIRAEQEISLPGLAAIALLAALAALGLAWWPTALWIALLAGLVGGKVFLSGSRWSKLFHLLALGYLVAALLLLVMPRVVPGGVATVDSVIALGRVGLPIVFVLMAVLPEGREADDDNIIDLVYGVFVFLLLDVLALGSLALMLLSGRGYAEALLETLLAIGGLLLLLGWLWNPHVGFGGMGALFSRHVLSLGLPVERWLHALADLAERQDEPDLFVAEACGDMARRLPWVAGGDWSVGSAAGTFGVAKGRRSEFRYEALTIGIYTRHPLGPSLLWHFKLLAQLVGEFHADKLRARQLRRLSYMEAVHETGARLTHDVKNLLQSLRALCAGAGSPAQPVAPEFVALLRRQLPAITQRLGQTLEKLQVPRGEETTDTLAAGWWQDLWSRYEASAVAFSGEGDLAAARLPATLFANVAENLLENALAKRQLAPALKITARLCADEAGVALTVCDDGDAIAAELAAELLRGPVASENGLGIGLYQAARLAEINGYALSLAENRPGRVCFQLRPLMPCD